MKLNFTINTEVRLKRVYGALVVAVSIALISIIIKINEGFFEFLMVLLILVVIGLIGLSEATKK